MLKSVFLSCFLVFSLCLSAQKKDHALEPFTRIDIFGPFDVELIKSDREFIEMDYRGIDSEHIIAEVNRNELQLKLRNKHYMNEWGSHDYKGSDYVKVRVYYKEIDEIQAQAGARVKNREQLKSRNMMINASMGAEVRLDVLAKNLYVKSSMGSILNLDGETEYLEVKASMGAIFKGSQLQSKTAYVKATMGAEVDVYASEELEVSAGFGATVDYLGDPVVRNTSRTLGAEINGRGNN